MFGNMNKTICAVIACFPLLLAVPAASVAQNAEDECSAGTFVYGEYQCIDVERELAHVEAYFARLDGPLLNAAQALVGTEPDGKRGPNTERAFRRSLET
jgi:hypothetical protein